MSTAEGIGSSTSNQWSPALASLGSALTTYLQDKMLKKVDVDSNGGVEQSEFRAALEQLSGKLGVEMDESSEALFTDLDADASGSLNGEEMGQLLRQVFAAPTSTQEFVNARGADSGSSSGFDALDVDGSGTITRAEFDGTPVASTESTGTAAPVAGSSETDSLKALLASADANKNGELTSTEVDQFIAQLASQMQLALTQLNDSSPSETQLAGTGSSDTATG